MKHLHWLRRANGQKWWWVGSALASNPAHAAGAPIVSPHRIIASTHGLSASQDFLAAWG
jgi:hypothetical protein